VGFEYDTEPPSTISIETINGERFEEIMTKRGLQYTESFAGNYVKKFFSHEILNDDRAQVHDKTRVHNHVEESDESNNGHDDDRGGASRHVMLRMSNWKCVLALHIKPKAEG